MSAHSKHLEDCTARPHPPREGSTTGRAYLVAVERRGDQREECDDGLARADVAYIGMHYARVRVCVCMCVFVCVFVCML